MESAAPRKGSSEKQAGSLLIAVILLALFGLVAWFALKGQKPRELPGPDAMATAATIDETEWRRQRLYRGMGNTLSISSIDRGVDVSEDSNLRAESDTKELRLLRRPITGGGSGQILHRWPLSAFAAPPRFFVLSPDYRWALLVDGKAAEGKSLQKSYTFTVRAVALDGTGKEQKWTIHTVTDQYANPFYPEWRSDSRAWRLWRNTTLPPARTSKAFVEYAPQKEELVEAVLDAPASPLNVIWSGYHSDYPRSLVFAPDGTSLAMIAVGAAPTTRQMELSTREVVFLRYKEPSLEKTISRTRFSMPPGDFRLLFPHPDGTKVAVILTIPPAVKPNNELERLLPQTDDRSRQEHVVRQGGRELWLLDLLTGQRTRVGLLPYLDAHTQISREEEIGWARDGKALLIKWTDRSVVAPRQLQPPRYYRLPLEAVDKTATTR